MHKSLCLHATQPLTNKVIIKSQLTAMNKTKIDTGITQKEVHDLEIKKGWYETPREPLGLICLIHSELSEAVECCHPSGG